MKVASPGVLAPNSRRHVVFVSLIVISSLLFCKTLAQLATYSLHDDSNSHIVLIPFISFSLLYMERQRVFSSVRTSVGSGAGLAICGLILWWLAHHGAYLGDGNWRLTFPAIAVVLIWIGGFLLCYGSDALRAGIFPLLFLFLMVPLPEVILDRTIHALQEGSTDVTYLIFQAVGMPVVRHGFLLSVPGVTIEVAKECSSIRSSVALLITCLIAAHLYLRTSWKIILMVLLVVPVSVIKNGIRIATLTLLSIYVDPSFLTGKLHHEGGFVFFLVALLILWPIFSWLARSEKARGSVHGRSVFDSSDKSGLVESKSRDHEIA